MKVFYAVCVMFFVSTTSIAQTTYYVSATNGDNSNNGTSMVTPWRTITKVNEHVFLPGDIILFKRGDTWIGEQLEVSGYSGLETLPITFGAYPNTGDPKPVISTIIEHPHTWINQGGNLWKAVNPPDFHPDRIWVDDVELLRANNLDEIDGVHFLWHYDKDENGDLYLYANANPVNKQLSYTNGKVAIIIEDTHDIVFSNLDLQGGWTSIYIVDRVNNVQIKESTIGKNASTGIDINSRTTFIPSNIKISNCTFDANFTLDYSMAGTYRGSGDRGCSDGIFMQCAIHSQISNNSFKNWGHASINIDGNPFGADAVKVSDITVNDNFLTSPDIIYGGRLGVDDAHDCNVYNNSIIKTSVQTQLNGYNNHFHHNIIDGTTNPTIVEITKEISAGISVESYSNTPVHHNVYEHNIIKNTQGAGFRLTNSGFFDIHDNIIRNNIIFNCGTIAEETGIGIRVEEDTNTSHIFRNTFDNNLIYNANTTNTIDFRSTVTNTIGFNALTGTSSFQIQTNISGNPYFVNENTDYHLLVNSPCINAGESTSLTQDFDGNPLPFASTLPDIGAYEFQATLSINNFSDKNTVFVYPNPTQKYLKIADNGLAKTFSIKLINSNGQIVMDKEISNYTIDLTGLVSGIYFLQIKGAAKMSVTKIVLLK